jgi:hypothetical protein
VNGLAMAARRKIKAHGGMLQLVCSTLSVVSTAASVFGRSHMHVAQVSCEPSTTRQSCYGSSRWSASAV